MKLEHLCEILGHHFQSEQLLIAALTHRSAPGAVNNERLEFLGDALLNLVVAEALFQRYPQADEGDLSRLRATLVKGDTLAGIARELDLGLYLRLGEGELKSGGHRRGSILADAMEALLAAVYLDSDFTTCRRLIQDLYRERLDALPPVAELKDPKTRLQERLQAEQQPLPVYQVLAVSGAPHQRQFTIECRLGQLSIVAEGSSRRKAEQEAARKALEQLS